MIRTAPLKMFALAQRCPTIGQQRAIGNEAVFVKRSRQYSIRLAQGWARNML